jgi:hypothetical protein
MSELLKFHSDSRVSPLETSTPNITTSRMQESLEGAYSASPKSQGQSLTNSPAFLFQRVPGRGELVIHYLERVVDAAFVRYRR